MTDVLKIGDKLYRIERINGSGITLCAFEVMHDVTSDMTVVRLALLSPALVCASQTDRYIVDVHDILGGEFREPVYFKSAQFAIENSRSFYTFRVSRLKDELDKARAMLSKIEALEGMVT